MAAVTIYLSRLIGVVALLVAVMMLVDKAAAIGLIEHAGQDRVVLLVIGLGRVVCGAAIVLIHNVWTRGVWPLVVTLTGWAMLVRGVMNLFLPAETMASLLESAHTIEFYYIYAMIPLVLGSYLALRGFSAQLQPQT